MSATDHETRHPAWTPPVLASAREATMGSSAWALEVRERPDRELGRSLAALAQRSSGGSVFFEPAFLNASWHRFGAPPKRLMVLFEEIGEARIPRLAFPFSEETAGFPPMKASKAFSHPFAPISLPLMERDDAGEIAERFASLLARLSPGLPFLFEDFPADEPEAALLREALCAAGFSLASAETRQRASLSAGCGDPKNWLDRKRNRELARQMRRLGETGKLDLEVARDLRDVMLRFEEFLLLETRGWKGRKGSSIHIVRQTAAFARQAVAALAAEDRAEILSLRLDGRSLASLIVLRSQNRYYPWKMAFDEAWRSYAPGTQLIVRASEHILASPGFEHADSLARADSWIDRLWPGKSNFETLVVGRSPEEAARVQASISRLRGLKETARRIIRR